MEKLNSQHDNLLQSSSFYNQFLTSYKRASMRKARNHIQLSVLHKIHNFLNSTNKIEIYDTIGGKLTDVYTNLICFTLEQFLLLSFIENSRL